MITRKYFYLLLILLSIISILWVIINFLTFNKTDYSLTICTLKNISGLPCASCGVTRSVLAFFSGNVGKAFFYNPIGIPMAIAIVILPGCIAYDLTTQKYNLYKKYNTLNFNLITWLSIITLFILAWAWNLYKHFNQIEF